MKPERGNLNKTNRHELNAPKAKKKKRFSEYYVDRRIRGELRSIRNDIRPPDNAIKFDADPARRPPVQCRFVDCSFDERSGELSPPFLVVMTIHIRSVPSILVCTVPFPCHARPSSRYSISNPSTPETKEKPPTPKAGSGSS